MKQFIRIARRFFRKYRRQTTVITGLFLMVIAMGVTCAFKTTKNIKVIVDPNTLGTERKVETHRISAPLVNTVEDVLVETGYSVSSDDYTIDAAPDKKVKDVDVITIKKKAVGQIVADGNVSAYQSDAATVGDLLSANGIIIGGNDVVTPSVDTPLTTDILEIQVSRIEIKEETTAVPIPFGREVKGIPELAEGVKMITTPGVDGQANITDRVTYQDGAEISRETISNTPAIAPITEITGIGTQGSAMTITTGNSTQDPGSDFDLICAVVQQEGGATYEGALAVMTCVMNRVDLGYAKSAADVLKASGQFEAYFSGAYQEYMGSSSEGVQMAVKDVMENGIRCHGYKNFRSYETTNSVCMSGNWYFN